MEKLLITTEELQQLTSLGHEKAIEIGTEAEARVQYGRAVRWNLDKIKTYLNQISK